MSYTDYPNVWLTTLNYLQAFLEGGRSNWKSEDVAVLVQKIEDASALFVEALERLPLPYVDTNYADWSKDYISIDSKTLTLHDTADLLEITSITNGDSSSVGVSSYTLSPNNRYPKQEINLKPSVSTYWRGDTLGNWQQVISIVGVWGYVPHYATAWKLTGATVQNASEISATETSLEVGSGNASAFSRGDYLKLEDEVVFVDAVDTDANTLTLIRADLGTTASAHANGTTIKRFVQRNDIKNAVTVWAAYLYKSKDKVGEDLIAIDGVARIPRGLDQQVIDTIRRHRKVYMR